MVGGYGSGFTGPGRDYRPAEPVLRQALGSIQSARAGGGRSSVRPHAGGGGGDGGDPDEALEAQLARTPNIVGPGSPRLDPDADENEIVRYATQPREFSVGGRPYQIDPRIGLGLELARQRQTQGVQMQTAANAQQLKQQEMEARVERLKAAGYAEKEAIRQVFGGPRTVEEEQQLVNTRSADQLEKDKFIQSQISARAEAAAGARASLQETLQRARSGDKNAAMQLRAQKYLLDDATKAHAAAVKARQFNALGTDLGDPAMDPGDAALNAAVDETLNDLQSSEAARQGAIAGIRKGATAGAPGTAGVSDDDAAAFIGVRQPTTLNDASTGSVTADPMAKYHRAFQKGTLPGQTGPGAGLAPKPAMKSLAPDQHKAASSDTAYKAWLQGKGYDVSGVPHPDDAQPEETPPDEGSGADLTPAFDDQGGF
jgi:hypothetical protein